MLFLNVPLLHSGFPLQHMSGILKLVSCFLWCRILVFHGLLDLSGTRDVPCPYCCFSCQDSMNTMLIQLFSFRLAELCNVLAEQFFNVRLSFIPCLFCLSLFVRLNFITCLFCLFPFCQVELYNVPFAC